MRNNIYRAQTKFGARYHFHSRLSTGESLYDVTSCPGGPCPVVSVQGDLYPGVSVRGVSFQGGLFPGGSLSRGSLSGGVSVQGNHPSRQKPSHGHRPPGAVKSGKYTSYWNAFLFLSRISQKKTRDCVLL